MKDTTTLTNNLLLAILNQLYSIELLLADAYNGKANLRYSNKILAQDNQLLKDISDMVAKVNKEVMKNDENQN